MQPVAITLERPVSQFVEQQSRDRNVPHQETVKELVTLGFETLFKEQYQRYRRGEISFGRLAHELGITTWELSHLLEERGWLTHNLPSREQGTVVEKDGILVASAKPVVSLDNVTRHERDRRVFDLLQRVGL